ncbi:MAG: adenylate kinase [Legionellales bacterium]|jgi:adenylate kinase
MRIILLGAPGVGKGTQASLLAQALNIPKIATGDMLRAAVQAKTSIGLKAKSFMDAGQLVPDDVIIQLAVDRIKEADCAQGFIFDGFPRTLAQAQALQDHHVKIDQVLEIQVDDEEIIHRLCGRRIHLASGRIYHIHFNPPKVSGKDDLTGEELIQRDDDQEITIRKRLQVYREQTQALVAYYQNMKDADAPQFHTLSGVGDTDKIHQQMLNILKNI